jgi:hypothetical protein
VVRKQATGAGLDRGTNPPAINSRKAGQIGISVVLSLLERSPKSPTLHNGIGECAQNHSLMIISDLIIRSRLSETGDP